MSFAFPLFTHSIDQKTYVDQTKKLLMDWTISGVYNEACKWIEQSRAGICSAWAHL